MTTTASDQARLTTISPAILRQNDGSGISLNTTKVEIEPNADQDNSTTNRNGLDKRQQAQQHYKKLHVKQLYILAYANRNANKPRLNYTIAQEHAIAEKNSDVLVIQSDS